MRRTEALVSWLASAWVTGSASAQVIFVQPPLAPLTPVPVVSHHLPPPAVRYDLAAMPAPALSRYLVPGPVPRRIERYYFNPLADSPRKHLAPNEPATSHMATGGVIIREYYYPAGPTVFPAPQRAVEDPSAPPKLKTPTPEEAIGTKAQPAEEKSNEPEKPAEKPKTSPLPSPSFESSRDTANAQASGKPKAEAVPP